MALPRFWRIAAAALLVVLASAGCQVTTAMSPLIEPSYSSFGPTVGNNAGGDQAGSISLGAGPPTGAMP